LKVDGGISRATRHSGLKYERLAVTPPGPSGKRTAPAEQRGNRREKSVRPGKDFGGKSRGGESKLAGGNGESLSNVGLVAAKLEGGRYRGGSATAEGGERKISSEEVTEGEKW